MKNHAESLLAIASAFLAYAASLSAAGPIPSDLKPSVIVSTAAEPVATGKFQPTWESLSQYEVPEWFRDRKFGIWAHWGPQCQPQAGDWYARKMYAEGSGHYRHHVANYGHPSEFGFKDVINEWKAEKWEPEKLVALYRRAGAQYFFAMANHHDNFDMWDSKHHPWKSVAIDQQRRLDYPLAQPGAAGRAKTVCPRNRRCGSTSGALDGRTEQPV